MVSPGKAHALTSVSVDASTILDGWPGSPTVGVLRLVDGVIEEVAASGDLDAQRPWASVSKLVVAMAIGVEVDWGLHRYDDELGPPGATLAHHLSHSAGFGLEAGDATAPVGTKRVYSNVAVDRAVAWVVGGESPGRWLDDRVFSGLGMDRTVLDGRPAAGVVGSTRDLMTFAGVWLRSDGLAVATRDLIVSPHLAELDGIVPGFGRFRPCPWGLGPEIRGDKGHWMGDWPSDSAGHFGKSGALVLFNVRERIAVVATSTVAFGPWAVALWPSWTSAIRTLALTS